MNALIQVLAVVRAVPGEIGTSPTGHLVVVAIVVIVVIARARRRVAAVVGVRVAVVAAVVANTARGLNDQLVGHAVLERSD